MEQLQGLQVSWTTCNKALHNLPMNSYIWHEYTSHLLFHSGIYEHVPVLRWVLESKGLALLCVTNHTTLTMCISEGFYFVILVSGFGLMDHRD